MSLVCFPKSLATSCTRYFIKTQIKPPPSQPGPDRDRLLALSLRGRGPGAATSKVWERRLSIPLAAVVGWAVRLSFSGPARALVFVGGALFRAAFLDPGGLVWTRSPRRGHRPRGPAGPAFPPRRAAKPTSVRASMAQEARPSRAAQLLLWCRGRVRHRYFAGLAEMERPGGWCCPPRRLASSSSVALVGTGRRPRRAPPPPAKPPCLLSARPSRCRECYPSRPPPSICCRQGVIDLVWDGERQRPAPGPWPCAPVSDSPDWGTGRPPRPGFFPWKSRETSPSGERTTRISSRFGFISRQPRHWRRGIFFGTVPPPYRLYGRSALAVGLWDGIGLGVGGGSLRGCFLRGLEFLLQASCFRCFLGSPLGFGVLLLPLGGRRRRA